LGHKLVSGLRGFENVPEHDEVILRNLRAAVREGDDLWILGDIAFDGWESRIGALSALPCRKHLVLGNHDRAHPLNSRAHEYLAAFGRVFDTVQTFACLNYEGTRFLLSHFPYDGDSHGEDRESQWRLRDEGRVLLHGHTHAQEKFSRSALGTPQLHVGLDAWDLKPATLAQIYILLCSHSMPDALNVGW
jgi:calcineurin-like phosphoesterase family protein